MLLGGIEKYHSRLTYKNISLSLGRKSDSIFFGETIKKFTIANEFLCIQFLYVNFMSIYVNSLLDINLHLI